MTVYANKPAFNVREKLKELEKPSGIAGRAMLAADTPQEQFNLIGAGRRNFLYNGAMQVWQRGTSFSNVGGSGNVAYTVDRWNATRYASNDNDITREDATDLDGFRYCARSARSGGDTTTTARFFHQVLEQRDSWALGGNLVTFSFYARAGSGFNGGQITSHLLYHTDPTKEERLYYNNFISASGTGKGESHELDRSGPWKRFTNTMYIPANVQQVAVSVYTEQNLPNAVSADFFEITGCQLELGKVATPFEHRSYGEELALCQRYCYVIGHPSQVIYLGTGSMYTTTAANLSVPLPVQLRGTAPTFTRVANGTGNWLNVYVGATGTVSNATPLQGDYTQSNLRIYIPGAHSGSSPSAVGAGVWSMVLAGAKLIIETEL
jgi:hypothetical protein